MSLDYVRSLSLSPPAPAVAHAEARPTPDHAVRLPGGDWNLWRDFILRGAGFPASLVLALGSDAAATAADRYVDASREVARRRSAALAAVSGALDWADQEARQNVWARRRRIRRGTVQEGAGSEQEDALARALAVERSAHAAYLDAFRVAAVAADDEVARIASDARFREATFWQNHQAARRIAESFSRTSGRRRRRAEELIAMQVQRYAVKNDSIGFFGPIGWGRLSERRPHVDLRPGPALVDRRRVYFEGWCIDTLVDRFNQDPELKPWASPRVATGVWTDALHVYVPITGAVPVTPLQRRVLDLCDGRRTAVALATEISKVPGGVIPETEVFDTLEGLERLGLIVWRFEIAPQLEPERELEARVSAIGDAPRRAACAAALGELVAARDRVARSAGRLDEVEASLADLDATFVRLTGREPTRRPGQTYAARGLVYEDCHRDCALTLGGDFMRRLGPPLSIVLDGGRWAAAELARAVRRFLRQRHAELRLQHGEVVDGHLFYSSVLRTPPAATAALMAGVQERVQAAWQSVLRLDHGVRRLTRSVDDVAARAREAFTTLDPVWSRALYLSPDLMVAASGVEAFRRGDYHCVLGELHAQNSLVQASLALQHPDHQALADAFIRDTRDRTLVFTQLQKDSWLARTALSVFPPSAWQYQYGGLPNRTPCRPAPAAMFVAVDNGQTVCMRARDGSFEFDAIDLLGVLLCERANDIIKGWLPRAAHVPRVTIGDLTIARERWHTKAGDLPFLGERDPAAQFAAVRTWAREHGMPRYVFYKSPAEPKPCYLDFNSPTYTELFVKFMRHLGGDAVARVEEMLPDPTQVWLTDADGVRYTCELRMAATPA